MIGNGGDIFCVSNAHCIQRYLEGLTAIYRHIHFIYVIYICYFALRVSFDNIHLLAGCPNLVRQAKILGVTVSDDLRWSTHVLNIKKKANKRIFFFKVQLKRAKIPAKEILNFYCCCVRPVL